MARISNPERHNDILRAARVVFQQRGFAEARMAEIAERAGIAAGTLYLYFPSKEALAQALGDEYLVQLTNALLPYFGQEANAAIGEAVHTALDFSIREYDLLRFVRFTLGPDRALKRSRGERHFHQLIALALADRMDRGELNRYDPEALAELLIGMMQWMAEQVLLYGKRAAARYEETLIRLLQNALLRTVSPRRLKPLRKSNGSEAKTLSHHRRLATRATKNKGRRQIRHQ